MQPFDEQLFFTDSKVVERRRLELLTRLENHVDLFAIFEDLEQVDDAVFLISDEAASVIRLGLSDPRFRTYESTALATVDVAAQTPDSSQFVYQFDTFEFETLGTADGVVSVAREQLFPGEIEIHTHVFSRPDYLGQVDVGDLIAAIEGPAWVHPLPEHRTSAVRIFGILSVYPDGLAELQFYRHDLRENLDIWNHYGLKALGNPLVIADAY